jgi:hypothetical protein
MGYQFTNRLSDIMKKVQYGKRKVTLQLVANLCPNHSNWVVVQKNGS